MWLGQAYSDNLPSLRSTVPIQYNLIQVVKCGAESGYIYQRGKEILWAILNFLMS